MGFSYSMYKELVESINLIGKRLEEQDESNYKSFKVEDNAIAKIDENGRLYEVLFGSSYTIGKGEKFAQLVLCEVPKAVFYEVEKVGDITNDGRSGGFGSTGVK